MALDDRSPSAGPFTRWAILLALPLILSAAAMPWALERLRAERRALPAALAGAAPDGATAPDGAPLPPRHPEAPSAGEIEAARATAIDAARIEQRNLAGAVTFAPRPATTNADGERVAPFTGFGLSIESTPAGATVRVAGSDVGATPIVSSVACAPGREVEVRVEKAGYRPVHRTVRCRTDALLELSIQLTR